MGLWLKGSVSACAISTWGGGGGGGSGISVVQGGWGWGASVCGWGVIVRVSECC